MDIGELPAKVVGMSNEDYRRAPGDSRSFLHSVAKFGGEAQRWQDQGRSLWGGNAATAKGSDFDSLITGVLEGQNYDDLLVVPPEEVLGANGSRSTKAYKEWAASQTAIVCSANERAQYSEMYRSMVACRPCFELMQATTGTQWSVFFDIDGHLLKVRPDACTPTLWWDLKTTSHGWDRIYRSAIDYGYAEQAWLYTEGAKALGYGDFRMPFVFVQTVPPYGCRVFYLPEQMVEQAGQRLRGVMEQVRLRRATGVYMPEESNEITELEVPAWAMRQEEEVVL
jgi:hypothetical protein